MGASKWSSLSGNIKSSTPTDSDRVNMEMIEKNLTDRLTTELNNVVTAVENRIDSECYFDRHGHFFYAAYGIGSKVYLYFFS